MEYYSSLDASKLDQETPTLFELISASQLEALLSPSLRYILVHYAQRYPAYLLRITNRFDELNLLIRSFIECYFLKYWHGSFTENFYGIKRVSQTPISSEKYNVNKLSHLAPSMIEERRNLSALQMAVSILEITGTSYFVEKFNYQYELLYSKYITNQLIPEEASTPTENRKRRLQILFLKLYPYMQSAWRLTNLIATLSYLSGKTKSPSLLTFLFKINYARLNQYDYSRNEPPLPTSPKKSPNRVKPPTTLEQVTQFMSIYLAKPVVRLSKFMLGTTFPLAIFSLKFLEWWNSSSFAQTIAKSRRNELEDAIPSPAVLKSLIEVNQKPRSAYKSESICPLCKGEILNPAIIETGYVFCYTCVFNYLRDSHKIVLSRASIARDGLSSADESDAELDAGAGNSSRAQIKDEKTMESLLIEKGGRCPITGVKLLGCKWNEITGEFDVNGIRRLIF